MLKTIGGVAVGWVLTSIPSVAEKTPAGVTYEVIKKGDGPKPEIGELIAIRFVAFAGDNKIDDIFDTPEPYYTRLGSGGLLKGVETTLPLMKVGDRWKLTIPVSGNPFGPLLFLKSRRFVHSTNIILSLHRLVVNLQGELAFGQQGRKASAGKPRIPPNAEIIFEVEIVGLPGKEPELIDLIGSVDE